MVWNPRVSIHCMAETPAITKPDLATATTQLEEALANFRRSLPAKSWKPSAASASPTFAALRAWRMETAKSVEMPPYIIATDAQLQAIEKANPRSVEELKAVQGISPNKVATYGPKIIEVLAGIA